MPVNISVYHGPQCTIWMLARARSCASFYLSILNPVPTLIMIVLESFVMVGAGHESQHQAAPRGEEKLTKVATDEYSRHQARVTTLISAHGTDIRHSQHF